MKPQLRMAQYNFIFAAQGRLTMPALADGLWHGVFGRALHELVCLAPASRCEECLLLQRCDYAFLFKGVRPPGAEMMRKYDTIPVPHIFHLTHPTPPIIAAGSHFV